MPADSSDTSDSSDTADPSDTSGSGKVSLGTWSPVFDLPEIKDVKDSTIDERSSRLAAVLDGYSSKRARRHVGRKSKAAKAHENQMLELSKQTSHDQTSVAKVCSDSPAGDAALSSIRGLGHVVCNALAIAIRHDAQPQKLTQRVKKRVDLACDLIGPRPRNMSSIAAEANSRQVNRRELPEDLRIVAATMFLGQYVWATSMLSHYISEHDRGNLTILAALLYRKYDETPLYLRASDVEAVQQTTSFMQILGASASTELCIRAGSLPNMPSTLANIVGNHKVNNENGHGPKRRRTERDRTHQDTKSYKVFQVLLKFSLMLKIGNEYISVDIPMATPLSLADSTAGEIVNSVMMRVATLPMWADVVSRSKHALDAVTTDAAASEQRYERYISELSPAVGRMLLLCLVHRLNGIQGRVYLCVASLISGILALALAMRTGGSTFQLRSHLVHFLLSNVEVVPCRPPSEDDELVRYRKSFLDICLDQTSLSKLRRVILEEYAYGDWQTLDGKILYYTVDPKPDLEQWAAGVVWALLPHRVDEFPRGRWMLSVASVQDTLLLLGFFNALPRVAGLWLKKKKAAEKRATLAQGIDIWNPFRRSNSSAPALPICDGRADDDNAEDAEEILNRPRRPGNDSDWATFNETQKGDAYTFLSGSGVIGRTTVITVCLEPNAALMRGYLARAAKDFVCLQQAEALKKCGPDRRYSGTFPARIVHAVACKLESKFLDDVDALLTDSSRWLALPLRDRTAANASNACAMLCRGACGVTQIVATQAGYPKKLFGCLGPNSAQVLYDVFHDPICIMDEFSEKFIADFRDDYEHDRLEDFIAILLLLAITVEEDISGQECNNAYIRRTLKQRVTTWCQSHVDCSTAWLLHEMQKIQKTASTRTVAPADRTRAAGSTGRKRKRRGGGGTQRWFMGNYLKGRRMPGPKDPARKELFRAANLAYKQFLEAATPEELLDAETKGLLATVGHRHGGLGFAARAAASASAAADLASAGSGSDAAMPMDNGLASKLEEVKSSCRSHAREARQNLTSAETDHVKWRLDGPPAPAELYRRGAGRTPEPLVLPALSGIPEISWRHYVCPAPMEEFVRRMERDQPCGEMQAQDLRNLLTKRFTELHAPHLLSATSSLGKVAMRHRKVCFYAGQCLCGSAGKACRDTVARLQGFLRTTLAPKSAPRRLYDRGELCLCLEGNAERSFYIISIGNLLNYRFTLQALDINAGVGSHAAATSGHISCAVRTGPDARPNLWKATVSYAYTCSWKASLYRLHGGDELLDDFFPGRIELASLGDQYIATIFIPAVQKSASSMPALWDVANPNPEAMPAPLALEDGAEDESDGGAESSSGGSRSRSGDSRASGEGGGSGSGGEDWKMPPVDIIGVGSDDSEGTDSEGSGGLPTVTLIDDGKKGTGPRRRPVNVDDDMSLAELGKRMQEQPDNCFRWGPFSISRIKRKGEFIGYGGNCNKHVNTTGNTLSCKKAFNLRQGMSEDEGIRRVKAWLIYGQIKLKGSASPKLRDDHVHGSELKDPMKLPLHTHEELDKLLRENGFEPDME